MIELAVALEIVKNITAMILLMMQSATDAQRVVLLDRHLAMTKPFYDLINKINHVAPTPDPASFAAALMPQPGLRPVLPAPLVKP